MITLRSRNKFFSLVFFCVRFDELNSTVQTWRKRKLLMFVLFVNIIMFSAKSFYQYYKTTQKNKGKSEKETIIQSVSLPLSLIKTFLMRFMFFKRCWVRDCDTTRPNTRQNDLMVTFSEDNTIIVNSDSIFTNFYFIIIFIHCLLGTRRRRRCRRHTKVHRHIFTHTLFFRQKL